MAGPKRPENWGSMTKAQRDKWVKERNEQEQREKQNYGKQEEEPKQPQKPQPPTKPAGADEKYDDDDQEQEPKEEECGAEVVLKVRGEEVESMTLREVIAHVVRKVADIIGGSTD